MPTSRLPVWSPAEHNAHRAFLIVESVVFLGLAPLYASVKTAGNHDAFDPGPLSLYVLAAAYYGFWFGALALPVSVASLYDSKRTVPPIEFARTVLIECLVISLFAIWAVLNGPDAYGGKVLHWGDARWFGIATLVSSVPSIPIAAALGWWFREPPRTDTPPAA
jgi:hypothetical protein